MAFSVVWLGGVTLFLVGSLAAAVADTNAKALAFSPLTLGLLIFFVSLTAAGMATGRRQAAYLRSWLADQLETR